MSRAGLYISSHAKQENLYAVYETTDRHYWTELVKCNQQEFEKSGAEGKCIEAREFIIALPESIEKTATRNMFYDENGRHVPTKKEILDEKGNVRKSCKIVKKGEVYERNLFTTKNKLFKQEDFVDEVKHFYTDLINLLVKDDKEKIHVFDSSGLYLATKKIGKNNPKAEQIQIDNEIRMRWNCEVDRAIVSGVPETEIQQIKKKYITDRIRESVDVFGSQPERLRSIIMTAVMVLALLISKVLDKARELSAKLSEKETIQPIAEPNERRTTQIIPQTDKTTKSEKITHKEPTANPSAQKRELQLKTQASEQETPKIPSKPVMSAEAAAYPKLLKIYKELNRQNGIIFDAERERNELELECDSLKGLAKLTKKGELQSRIDRKNKEIDLLKVGLSGIAKRYGYQNVQKFYTTYYKSYNAYVDYRERTADWEKAYGKESHRQDKGSVLERIKNLPPKTADYQQQKTVKSKDRGAR